MFIVRVLVAVNGANGVRAVDGSGWCDTRHVTVAAASGAGFNNSRSCENSIGFLWPEL